MKRSWSNSWPEERVSKPGTVYYSVAELECHSLAPWRNGRREGLNAGRQLPDPSGMPALVPCLSERAGSSPAGAIVARLTEVRIIKDVLSVRGQIGGYHASIL